MRLHHVAASARLVCVCARDDRGLQRRLHGRKPCRGRLRQERRTIQDRNHAGIRVQQGDRHSINEDQLPQRHHSGRLSRIDEGELDIQIPTG